jgi:hypothetical protein
VPFLWVAKAADYGAPRDLPRNPYAHASPAEALTIRARKMNVGRFYASWLNPMVSAASVLIFYDCALLLGGCVAAAAMTTLLFAFGSLLWVYSGTFFSEPLAMAFHLLSFRYLLFASSSTCEQVRPGIEAFAFSGVALGAAALCHVTALLSIPFVSWWAWSLARKLARPLARAALPAFCAGLALMLGLLAWYNQSRFGDPFETGRQVSAAAAARFTYGAWTDPLPQLGPLLFSANKGLLVYCPACVAFGLSFKALWRHSSSLCSSLLGLLLFRYLFIASRSDWHGGFSPGPRLLLIVIPLFLLPLTLWLRAFEAKRYALAGCLLLIAAVEQLFLALGDYFRFYEVLRASLVKAGELGDHSLYLDWEHSMFPGLLAVPRAPLLLRGLTASNAAVFAGSAVVLAAALGVVCARLFLNARAGVSGLWDAQRGAKPAHQQPT